MPRTEATNYMAIRPFTAALRYTASTGTILGTGTTLNTTQSWAVSFLIDMSRGAHLTTNNGILSLETDQATPFIFLTLRGSSGRGFEFGSNANFDRFFGSVASTPNIFDKYYKGWHEMTVTFDGVDRTLDTSYRFYIDGVNIAVTNGSGLSASTDQNGIGVGVSGGVGGTFDMARLAIWNGGTTMTAAQVLDWAKNHILPTGPTLIRNYGHDDGSGTTLTDSTGNQNGTIGTATWITSNLPNMARTAIGVARTVAAARTVAS